LSQQRDITAHLDDPVALERLYREGAEAFRAALDEAYALRPEHPVLQVWKARLAAETVASPAEAPAPRGNVVLLVVLSLVAFGFAKLPWLVRGLDAATYLGRNGGFLATVPLALWVAYARATPAGARALVVVLSAGLLLHANLALHRPGDANVLALMHLPILQWTLVALAFLGSRVGTSCARLRPSTPSGSH